MCRDVAEHPEPSYEISESFLFALLAFRSMCIDSRPRLFSVECEVHERVGVFNQSCLCLNLVSDTFDRP